MKLQEKRTSMLALVESWKESGMTQIEFARRNNITLSKFRYWVHKSSAQNGESLSSGFIRVSDNGFSMKNAKKRRRF